MAKRTTRKTQKKQRYITQVQMGEYYRLTELIGDLRSRMRDLESQREEIKKELKSQLETGAIPEEGWLHCHMQAHSRRPAWKDEFEKRLGNDAALEVIAATPFTLRLVVEPVSEDD